MNTSGRLKKSLLVLSLMALSACTTVPKGLGNYDIGQLERGYASWYGGSFHGRLTANRDIFDQSKKTAAHRLLPLGSVVRVTNAENGRQVIVVINDRGPYLRGRVMDLSYAAADQLGAIKEGTIPILIEVTMRGNRGPTSQLVHMSELKPEAGFAAVRCPWVTEAEDLQADSEETSNIERPPGRVTRGPTDLPPLNRSRLGNRRGLSGRIGSYDE